MRIFVVSGMDVQIKTTALASGDMAVSGPFSRLLDLIMFDTYRWDGRRNSTYDRWIISSEYT